jgi:hypothetical protein
MASVAEKAKKIISENQDLFSSLEELDRTGKLRNARYKERATFTVDEDLMNRFRSHCKKNNMNMSKVVEDNIKRFLKDK